MLHLVYCVNWKHERMVTLIASASSVQVWAHQHWNHPVTAVSILVQTTERRWKTEELESFKILSTYSLFVAWSPSRGYHLLILFIEALLLLNSCSLRLCKCVSLWHTLDEEIWYSNFARRFCFCWTSRLMRYCQNDYGRWWKIRFGVAISAECSRDCLHVWVDASKFVVLSTVRKLATCNYIERVSKHSKGLNVSGLKPLSISSINTCEN